MASIPYSERKFDKQKANKYNQQYKKDNFDRIAIYAPKGTKDTIKEYCTKLNISQTEFIKMAIENLIEKIDNKL